MVPASATPITILNPSFELPTGHTLNSPPANWTSLAGGGAYNPYEFAGGNNHYYSNANATTDPANGGAGYPGINGEMLAYEYGVGVGAGLQQTLSATLQANTFYTLSIDVFARNGTEYLAGQDPWAGSELELLAGSTIIASAIDTSAGPTPGTFEVQTATVDSSTLNQNLIGQALTVRFVTVKSNGLTTDWDSITLDASESEATVPEPATLILMGAGLLGIVRRKKQ